MYIYIHPNPNMINIIDISKYTEYLNIFTNK